MACDRPHAGRHLLGYLDRRRKRAASVLAAYHWRAPARSRGEERFDLGTQRVAFTETALIDRNLGQAIRSDAIALADERQDFWCRSSER